MECVFSCIQPGRTLVHEQNTPEVTDIGNTWMAPSGESATNEGAPEALWGDPPGPHPAPTVRQKSSCVGKWIL